MRSIFALIFYGIAHAAIWIVGIGVSLLELAWLIQLGIDGAWTALVVLLMIGTPIILTIGYWISAIVAVPLLWGAIKLNPELGQ